MDPLPRFFWKNIPAPSPWIFNPCSSTARNEMTLRQNAKSIKDSISRKKNFIGESLAVCKLSITLVLETKYHGEIKWFLFYT